MKYKPALVLQVTYAGNAMPYAFKNGLYLLYEPDMRKLFKDDNYIA